MALKTMDPALVRQLIEGEEDVITPLVKAESELLEHCRCPVCGSQGADRAMIEPKVVPGEDGYPEVARAPFSNASPTVQTHARCRTCGTEYDPYTRVIISEPEEPVITSVQ